MGAFTLSLRDGIDLISRSNFKQSKANFNSEFFFSTGCFSRSKNRSLSYYLILAGENKWIPYGASTL